MKNSSPVRGSHNVIEGRVINAHRIGPINNSGYEAEEEEKKGLNFIHLQGVHTNARLTLFNGRKSTSDCCERFYCGTRCNGVFYNAPPGPLLSSLCFIPSLLFSSASSFGSLNVVKSNEDTSDSLVYISKPRDGCVYGRVAPFFF